MMFSELESVLSEPEKPLGRQPCGVGRDFTSTTPPEQVRFVHTDEV